MQTKIIPTSLFDQLLSDKFRLRFWGKVSVGNDSQCWEWRMGTNNMGYGQINCGRICGRVQMITCHRVAWMLFNKSPIPQGMYILHNCDNPKCCNPHHLRIGNQTDNARDCSERRRHRYVTHLGEFHGMSKVTSDQVLEIRRVYGSVPTKDIASMFNISKTNVRHIAIRKTWKHV